MHFHDDVFSFFRLAVYVVYKRTVVFEEGWLFFIEECNVCYAFFAEQQTVEKINNQRLGYLLSENPFESYVCKRVDEFCHNETFNEVYLQR